MNIYLWKEDIEDGESVMTAEYRPVEYGKDYDVVNNPDKFQLYIAVKKVMLARSINNSTDINIQNELIERYNDIELFDYLGEIGRASCRERV